ncbi:hypothetical protein [Streptomyces abikoensis]|uniref:Uncharacterized protein n=1 Tax=Streptomyces abikoensis TaxID=97398 RepID=A0ABW7TA13_9ACTN
MTALALIGVLAGVALLVTSKPELFDWLDELRDRVRRGRGNGAS